MSTILVGVDASERSEDAVTFTRALARASGARVVVACAFPYDDHPSRAANRAYRDALEEDARATAERLAAPLGVLGAERVEVRTVACVSPAHALQVVAEEETASLVVVGSSHTGRIGRVLTGSTAERLLHGSPCPVVVVPLGYREGEAELQRIGVADDGSSEAAAAVHAASVVARASGGDMTVVTVQIDPILLAAAPTAGASYAMVHDDITRATRAALDRTVGRIDPDLHPRGVLREGDPARELEAASAELDLLVTGSRRYGPLRSVLLGGVTGRVVRAAHCPVMVVPRGVDTPLDDLMRVSEPAAR